MELLSNEDYTNLTIEEETFPSNLTDTNFRKCNFTKVDFSNKDIRSVYFENCTFTNCDFSNCEFSTFANKGNTYINSKMIGLNFIETHFSNVSFTDCNLMYTNYSDSILSKVSFTRCNLSSSSFISLKKHTNLTFDECNLDKADFLNTPLIGLDLRTCEIGNIRINIENLRGLIVTTNQAISLASSLGLDIRE